MGKNLSNKIRNNRGRGMKFRGKAPEGWEQNPWSVPEEERQSCGFYNNCSDSNKCNEYGKVRSNKKKFFTQCTSYSWPLEEIED